jgi:hypothetical protein
MLHLQCPQSSVVTSTNQPDRVNERVVDHCYNKVEIISRVCVLDFLLGGIETN